MTLSWRHALAVWRRNASMYRRTWRWNILPNFFEPVLYLVSLGIGLGAYITTMGGTSYVQFLAPGLICVAAMNGASFEVTYNIFVRMNIEKAYDAMLTTPIQPVDVVVGELAWSMTRACIYGLCFAFVVGTAGLAQLPQALWMVPVVFLTGLLFSAIGLVFTLRIGQIELYSFYFTLFLTPLFLFSSVFFPLEERLSDHWLWVAEILPLLHPVRLARAVFFGPLSVTLLWDVTYILGLSTVLVAYATRLMKRKLIQ